MTWTMDQCKRVDKIEMLESFPYRFNDADVETYQLFKNRRTKDGDLIIGGGDASVVFFHKSGGRFWCCKVKFDIVVVGYKDMNQRGCTGQFDTHRVELARTIEEALDNFNAFQKEVWG